MIELKNSINETKVENVQRQLELAENNLSHRDLLIATLNSQLKQFQEQFKRNIDETQDLRFKYAQVVHELSLTKKILEKVCSSFHNTGFFRFFNTFK